ncbi:MAG: sigma-70 family RNA polymerase sigma factor [Myxococcales bacterium]|nr:sigma-70 family RNA polymerase sigma factor [Myxococcales bacterium]MDH5305565.1 sigma-70 family RNA polymerase sigma factor [Myxococcales bacterium]MDH5565194.1 sigma-70 family RNA polymerase sigma factor [Myxococcales bacterium]
MRSAARPTSELPDAEAVARARSGDHEAFRVLVERYQARAYRLALRMLRDPEQARDAVQEGFLKAYAALDAFEGRSGFYTWLYRMVFNLCIDTKRRDRSNRHVAWNDEVAVEVASSPVPAAAALGAPEKDAARGELRAAVLRAVAALPEDARRTLLLREVDGLSYAQIARALRIPKGTVMSRLHHARRRVREILIEAGALEPQVPPAEEGGAA